MAILLTKWIYRKWLASIDMFEIHICTQPSQYMEQVDGEQG